MTLIVCDTDFLLKVTTEPLPEVAQVLAESNYELVTLPKIEAELHGLSRSNNHPTARKARTALQALSRGSVKILKEKMRSSNNSDADALLVDFAERSKSSAIIATLDHSILSVLERKRLPYLTLRKNRPFFRAFESATYLLDKGQ
jgi:rRNA-processing protein FCF1